MTHSPSVSIAAGEPAISELKIETPVWLKLDKYVIPAGLLAIAGLGAVYYLKKRGKK